MAMKKIKHGLLVTAIGLGTLLGVAGFGMRTKHKDSSKATIELAGEKISLNKFYSHVSYDSKSDDFYYSDGSSSFYFSEIDDSLFQYKQYLNKIKQKPLIVKHDTIYVQDTSSSYNKYSLQAVNKDYIPSIDGLYVSNERSIQINHFLAHDEHTKNTAKQFLRKKDVVKHQVESHERQHDYNFINQITIPVGSPKELIENMYHDEFISYLRQTLNQYDAYMKTRDADCFSLDFMKKAALSGKLRLSYPLLDNEKELIANGIIDYVTNNSEYKIAAVKNAVKNVKFGNAKTFQENKNRQRTLLYKLYTMDVNGSIESFYPYFKNAELPITQAQINQVEQAAHQQASKKSALEEIRVQQLQDKDAFKNCIQKAKNSNQDR